jgi:dipeptidase E
MKLFLTCSGFTNETIIATFRKLLGKPTTEANIVIIPTGQNMVNGNKSWVYSETFKGPYELGWKQFDIVDLAAVSSLEKQYWWHKIESADVILVGGGNSYYLSYWLQQSGFADKLPSLLQSRMYVGISAGSVAVTPTLLTSSEGLREVGLIAKDVSGSSQAGTQISDKGLQIVDFGFRPHFGEDRRSAITGEILQTVSTQARVEVYGLDDQSALVFNDGAISIVSEGAWHLFKP